ncbi:MAG: RNA polymerase sigma factor [Planctomycetota bacterium]|nr:MAG: RNA polymerase sigma factor [Planctomycetota bacterium]
MEFSDQQVCAWTEQLERFLLKRLGSRVLARDIAHEATMRLLEAARGGYPPEEPRSWLFRIARNLAVDEVRRNLPCPLGLEATGLLSGARPPVPAPSWKLGPRELPHGRMLELLPAAVSSLPEHYQRLIRAHYHDGVSCEGMAQRERLSVANVKVRLFRARRRLRRWLVAAARNPQDQA